MVHLENVRCIFCPKSACIPPLLFYIFFLTQDMFEPGGNFIMQLLNIFALICCSLLCLSHFGIITMINTYFSNGKCCLRFSIAKETASFSV